MLFVAPKFKVGGRFWSALTLVGVAHGGADAVDSSRDGFWQGTIESGLFRCSLPYVVVQIAIAN